ncbi:CLIP-associated protein [Vitis vinifera]|uniref:CLIP-associated protein n=1 Tax=Vitis vinifera TaxID=29760 RepID=A0A438F1N5_VITVI|nr:CLIP-associated protein [Vitis vinifera]
MAQLPSFLPALFDAFGNQSADVRKRKGGKLSCALDDAVLFWDVICFFEEMKIATCTRCCSPVLLGVVFLFTFKSLKLMLFKRVNSQNLGNMLGMGSSSYGELPTSYEIVVHKESWLGSDILLSNLEIGGRKVHIDQEMQADLPFTIEYETVVFCLVDIYIMLGKAFLPYLEGLNSTQLRLVTIYANRISQARTGATIDANVD